jgi:hypothetical protein
MERAFPLNEWDIITIMQAPCMGFSFLDGTGLRIYVMVQGRSSHTEPTKLNKVGSWFSPGILIRHCNAYDYAFGTSSLSKPSKEQDLHPAPPSLPVFPQDPLK